MTPFETVLRYYRFPERIDPHPEQIATINDLAPRVNAGHFLDMGTGKTFVWTCVGLYHKIVYGHQNLVIMPPNLLPQWGRWLREISPELSVTEYRGSVAKRGTMDFEMDFVLVGIHIFKREFDRFRDYFQDKVFSLGIDEGTIVGNAGSDAHKRVYELGLGHPQGVLTGTPMGIPSDAYGIMKFSAPGTYENLRDFNAQHIGALGRNNVVKEWKGLEVLRENLKINSRRILFQDMYPNTETPLFDPIYYDLAPAHHKLYKKLAEEQILLLPDGGKIDGTIANNLIHQLGQIVVNYDHFTQVPTDVSETVEMITAKLTQMGDEKLVVFAHYKKTVATLKEKLKKFGAVTINSEVTAAQKDKNLLQFCSDPKCRVIVIQFISGSKGLDGMQFACHRMFFAEPCGRSRDFFQCVGRLLRMGQRYKVHVMMGIANGTTQIRGFKNLLTNDSLIGKVIRNAHDLRNAIYGVNQ